MKPQAATSRFDVRETGEVVVLIDVKSQAEHRLDAVAGAVWLRADGQHDVRELAAVIARDLDQLVSEPEVWAALDALGDAGLLEGRTAPPADSSISRRFLLRTAAVTGALFVGSAGAALAADDKAKAGASAAKDLKGQDDEVGRWRVAAEQAQKGEQSAKTQESSAKGSYESSAKGEQGSKTQESSAKTTAESAEKNALRDLNGFRAAEEQAAKLQRQGVALEAELARVNALEEHAKGSIAAEQSAKGLGDTAAERDAKTSFESAQKSSREFESKTSAEHAGKNAAEAAGKSFTPPAGSAP